MLTEYKGCHQHRTLVVILSSIIQAITLRSPTALIWSIARPTTSDPNKNQIVGSPLDKLACAPSELLQVNNETENNDTNYTEEVD